MALEEFPRDLASGAPPAGPLSGSGFILKELRRFTAGKTRQSREELLRSIPPDVFEDGEFQAHRAALEGRFIDSMRMFLALAIQTPGERGVLLDQALGAVQKAGKERRGLAEEILAFAPELAASPRYLDIVMKTAGVDGLDHLEGLGLLPPEIKKIAKRLRLEVAERLLASSKVTASTLDYVRAFTKTGLHHSRAPGDLLIVMNASILLSSRMLAMHNSDRPEVKAAASDLDKVIASKRIPAPKALLDRALVDMSEHQRVTIVRRLAGTRAVFTDAYEGDEEVKGSIVETLVSNAVRSRESGLLVGALTSAGRTIKFWTDENYRIGLSAELSAAAEGMHDANAAVLRSRLALGQGDLNAYEVQIEALKALDGPIQDGGYQTYLSGKANSSAPLLVPPQLIEVVPRKGVGDRAVAVACADINFFRRWARAFVTTHSRTAKGNMPHIHVMAGKEHLQELLDFAKDFKGISISLEEPLIKLPYYYATNRFFQIENLSNIVNQPIVLVDIDVTFVADVSEPLLRHNLEPDMMFRINDRVRLFDHDQNYRLAYDYPRLDAWAIVPGGYLYASRSETGQEMAKVIAHQAAIFLSEFQNSGRTNWWIDQNLLFRAFMLLRKEFPSADIKNIADYGLPYAWRRPEGSALLEPRGIHPLFAEPPRTPLFSERIRAWMRGAGKGRRPAL